MHYFCQARLFSFTIEGTKAEENLNDYGFVLFQSRIFFFMQKLKFFQLCRSSNVYKITDLY